MNEEQADRLIYVLEEIKEVLKPKQEKIFIKEIIKDETIKKLQRFKDFITSNEFWNTLTKEQMQKIIDLR